MKVYVLMIELPYEGAVCLGVFRLEKDAEAAKTEAVKKDESNGYNEFNIEPHELK